MSFQIKGFSELIHFIMAFYGVGKGWLLGGKPEVRLSRARQEFQFPTRQKNIQ